MIRSFCRKIYSWVCEGGWGRVCGGDPGVGPVGTQDGHPNLPYGPMGPKLRNFAVFTGVGGALLLANCESFPFSVDELLFRRTIQRRTDESSTSSTIRFTERDHK
jgi:hypothetical protein